MAPAADVADGGTMRWYRCKCCVCKKEVSQNAFEILQPEIFVCLNCRDNARQMLAIKNFAKEVNVKIDLEMPLPPREEK